MIWNENNEDRIFIISYYALQKKKMLKDYLDMIYFGEGCSNIYSQNNMLQHPFGSNLIFFNVQMKYS